MSVSVASLLEILQQICKEYQDESYVYKSCIDITSENNIVSKKLPISKDTVSKKLPISKDADRDWLVVMKKIKNTITNEMRIVKDKAHAKYRANKLLVVDIINMNDPSQRKECIINCFESIEQTYEINKITTCNDFNPDINVICGGGIHYFTTLECAFYYGRIIKDGKFMIWYDNGEKKAEGYVTDGQPSGIWIGWYTDGKKYYEENYKNGERYVLCTKWYDNGNIWQQKIIENKEVTRIIEYDINRQKISELNYKNGKLNGSYFDKDWQREEEGNYINGKKDGIWREYNCYTEKTSEMSYVNDELI